MYRVRDTKDRIKKRISESANIDSALPVLMASAYFEWSLRRAIKFLGCSPNTIIDEKINKAGGNMGKLRALWRAEVSVPRRIKTLDKLIPNWKQFLEARKVRHGLIHGFSTVRSKKSREAVREITKAYEAVHKVCKFNGYELHSHMKIRQVK